VSNRILITGGAGFVGLHLARHLVNNGYQVDLVDNFARGIMDAELEQLISKTSVSFMQLDLTDQKSITDLGSSYHAIYHLAGIVGVKHVLNRPYEVMDANIRMLQNVITIARRQSSLNRLLFASTSEVYAGTLEKYGLEIPTAEGSNIVVPCLSRPRTTYMLSKIVGEVMCQHSGVPFTIFRPHNIYGPRMGMAHVIPELLKRVWDMQSPQTLEVYSVDHCRSFCYIDDAVEMLMRMLNIKACGQKTLNLGAETPEVTMRDLAQICIDLIGKKLIIKPMATTLGSPHRRAPNMSLARDLLEYESKIGLERGIKETLDWYREHVFDGIGATAQ
jgi:nucleoside-diphosphate-sugar epimerase